MIRALLIPLLALAACGPPQPMTQARAERLCAEEARQADGISGNIGVGGGSNGPFAGGNLTITNRIFDPVPEAEALERCVNRRLSGNTSSNTGNGLTIGISTGVEL